MSQCESTPSKEELLEKRKRLIGPAVTMFYRDEPLMVMRAKNQYLYDEHGAEYLDCISNVQHVGHCHPAVVDAIEKQSKLTTCNNRFVHPLLTAYAERLSKTLPDGMDTFFYCNSGSEANDLALRIAMDCTGGTEIITVDHAYHGHLTSMIAISPYKFNGKGGDGKPDHVYIAPCPDAYRGKWRLDDDQLNAPQELRKVALQYADEVKSICQQILSSGRKLAAFYMEALISCGGQVLPPEHYLSSVVKHVHDAGGLVIIDEVQTGFGRAGGCFWAYQTHWKDGSPDIITLGKPMGNGYPVAAVVTNGRIGRSFGRGMEYFNTYGGNPVACAAALAVLDVLKREQLQENAEHVGAYLLDRLLWLQKQHPSVIGHVRGVGLFVGVDLVEDRNSRNPASGLASKIVHEMRLKKVCLSSEGPHGNILKFKPPMCFSKANVDHVIKLLDATLKELLL